MTKVGVADGSAGVIDGMKVLFGLALMLLGSIGPVTAQNAAPTVLRHLAYDVKASSTLRKDEHQSGLAYANMATGQVVGTASGGNFDTVSHSESNTARLVVDIVAATNDGGLVADVSLNGTTRNLGKTRIAITSDGALGFDPNLDLPPEVAHVLPLLGRGVIAGHAVGDSWSVPVKGRGATGKNAFRILSDAGSDRVNVEVVTDLHVSGTSAFDESSRTTSVYASRLTNPISLTYTGLLHEHQTAQALQTIDLSVTASLVEDSFAGR